MVTVKFASAIAISCLADTQPEENQGVRLFFVFVNFPWNYKHAETETKSQIKLKKSLKCDRREELTIPLHY